MLELLETVLDVVEVTLDVVDAPPALDVDSVPVDAAEPLTDEVDDAVVPSSQPTISPTQKSADARRPHLEEVGPGCSKQPLEMAVAPFDHSASDSMGAASSTFAASASPFSSAHFPAALSAASIFP